MPPPATTTTTPTSRAARARPGWWSRRVRGWLSAAAAAVGCSAAHGLLQAHYVSYCRGSWLALFAVDPSPYCGVVRRALDWLQFAPLAPLLTVVPLALPAGNKM